MDHESSYPSSGDRTRYLNIVYFIESARSHTIRINLAHARWAAGASILVFTWAVGSIFWITALRFQITAARNRLETSLTTIFDYQIKNDKVFDLAYPPDATNGYYSESAQLASNNPLVEKTVAKDPVEGAAVKKPDPAHDKPLVKSQTKALLNDTEKSLEKPAPQTSAQPSVAAEASHETLERLIEISNAKISKTGSKYSLVFDINNLSKKKAEGYIWTVASFASENGQTTLSAAPEQTKIDGTTGDIVSIKSAYRFSIQRYKNKVFDFKTPAGKNWKLSALKIHFSDVVGTAKDAVEIPVDQVATPSAGGQAVPADAGLN